MKVVLNEHEVGNKGATPVLNEDETRTERHQKTDDPGLALV